MKENILSKFLTACPFPEVFEDTEPVEAAPFRSPGARSAISVPTTMAGVGTIPCGPATERLLLRKSAKKSTAFMMH